MQRIQPELGGIFLEVFSPGSDQESVCLVKAEVSSCRIHQPDRCERSS